MGGTSWPPLFAARLGVRMLRPIERAGRGCPHRFIAVGKKRRKRTNTEQRTGMRMRNDAASRDLAWPPIGRLGPEVASVAHSDSRSLFRVRLFSLSSPAVSTHARP